MSRAVVGDLRGVDQASGQMGRALEVAPVIAISLSSIRLIINIDTTLTLLVDAGALLRHFIQDIPLARTGLFCSNIGHK